MNTERLHVIAKALNNELGEHDIPGKVAEFAQQLRASANSPGEPGHQQRVGELRQELSSVLSTAPSNGFSPAWRDALEELEVDDLAGDQLLAQIEGIFDRNEITPSVAADEMEPLATRMERFQNALQQLLSSFEFFEIGAEELDPGEFEIGFLIPRDEVNDGLEQLGLEFIRLKKIIGPFQEISAGPRDELELRSISSSAFAAFLMAAPGVAYVLAKTLESLINSYEKVKGMREAHAKLKESGAQDKLLKEAAKEVEDIMAREIKALAKELLAEAKKEKAIEAGRTNELRKELEVSLNALANRIDKGYTVEVRAGELPPPDDEDEDTETPDEKHTRQIVEQVLEAQERLSFKNDTGESILQLPEPDAEPDPPASGGEGKLPQQ